MIGLDFEAEQLWDFYRHIFPHFRPSHVLVYRLLWRIEPMTGDEIVSGSGLSRATVFKALSELINEGLVKKVRLKHVGYSAPDPLRAYSIFSRRISMKLKNGREKIETLIKNSSGLSGELYLIKRDGGQQRLISKETRQTILDEEKLIALRKAIELQLHEANEQKLKAWALCK